MALVGRKKTLSDISFSLRNLLVHAFGSRAQRFTPPLARRRSSCPPPSPNLVRTHPIEHCSLRDNVSCLSRATTPPEGHQIGARKRRAPGNTILSQPYRRRVSTDRLNREGMFAISRVGDFCVLRLPLYLLVRLLPQRVRHASAYPGGSVSDNKFQLLYSLLVSPHINKITKYDQKFHFTMQLN